MTYYILSHPLWGWLCLPDYPSLWSTDYRKAHRFRSRSAAQRIRRRWNEAVDISVEREITS